MDCRYFFKRKSRQSSKLIATVLFAVFSLGSFSSAVEAMNPDSNLSTQKIETNVKNSEDTGKIKAEELISCEKDNKVFGYDKNRDLALLDWINENYNEVVKYLFGEEVKFEELLNGEDGEYSEQIDFLYSNSEVNLILSKTYGEGRSVDIHSWFKRTYEKKLTHKDIVFAVCKDLSFASCNHFNTVLQALKFASKKKIVYVL